MFRLQNAYINFNVGFISRPKINLFVFKSEPLIFAVLFCLFCFDLAHKGFIVQILIIYCLDILLLLLIKTCLKKKRNKKKKDFSWIFLYRLADLLFIHTKERILYWNFASNLTQKKDFVNQLRFQTTRQTDKCLIDFALNQNQVATTLNRNKRLLSSFLVCVKKSGVW